MPEKHLPKKTKTKQRWRTEITQVLPIAGHKFLS